MTYEITWEKDEGRWSAGGEIAKLGRWSVGSAGYNGASSKNEPRKYTTNISLPGIKNTFGPFMTMEQAKAKAEEVINYWMKGVIR